MSENMEKVSKDIFKGELVDISSEKDQDRKFKTLKLDNEVFLENLPEGVTQAQYKKIKKYEREYISAGLEYAGDVAEKKLEEDKNLAGVNVKLQYGDQRSGYVNYSVTKKKEGNIGGKSYANSLVSVSINEHMIPGKAIETLKNRLTEKFCK